jgi:hypothetical protein
LVLKILTKNLLNKEKNKKKFNFVEQENESRKPDKNSGLRRLEFMPGNLD